MAAFAVRPALFCSCPVQQNEILLFQSSDRVGGLLENLPSSGMGWDEDMREEALLAMRAVEEATGIPVLVTDDSSLRTMATIKPAKSGSPAHLLRYNPKFTALADYLIAFQCGFALRLFLAPETSRFELGGSDQGRQTAGRLLDDHLKKGGLRLPVQAVTGLRDQFFDGLMLQLRSMPVGLRVDAWVRNEYPGLHEQQDDATRRQLAENQQALSPQVKQMVPKLIYEASVGMSAAYAAFWERVLTDPTVVVPYRVAGLLAIGEKLLRLADEIPDDAANDKRLVEAWGDQIGVTGWFRLLPFEG